MTDGFPSDGPAGDGLRRDDPQPLYRQIKQRLRQQIEELRIEIDESRKARQGAEITETDYFQTLQRKARKMRGENRELG